LNKSLTEDPKIINSHPLTEGWIAEIKFEEANLNASIGELLNEEQYEKYLEELKQ
jgi:glycine cleavage system H lipoate-binding protein